MKNFTTANVKIGTIMTKDLVTITLESTVEEAVKKMAEHEIECLPVIDAEGVLHGLVTFRDIVMKVVYPLEKARESKVENIMSQKLVVCNPDSTVLDVVKIMKNRHLRRIPVVDENNKLVGLVTDFDLALFGWNFK
jgi:CBS domain-containing protein